MRASISATICSLYIFASSMLQANHNHDFENDSLAQATSENDTRKYYTFNYPSSVPGGNTLLTGIRGTKSNPDKVYISGFYKYPGGMPVIPFVYKGRLSGKGTWNILNYPSSPGVTVVETNLYGPNNGRGSDIQVVGNYTTEETGTAAIGCLYEGPLYGSGTWTTLIPTSSVPVLNTIAHSTMGGLVVGNYDTQLDEGKAFIYDIKTYHDIIKPGAKSITAYGIWHNGGDCYTICGGYSDADSIAGFEAGYLVDWNNKCQKFSNWRTYHYNNAPIRSLITHFDGITSDGHGGYNLTGDWLGVGEEGPELGFFCHIKKNRAKWSPVSFPGQLATSGNSVYKKVVIGVYTSPGDEINGYISLP